MFDVGDVRAAVFRGTQLYIDVRNVFSPETIFSHEIKVATLPEGTYTLLFAPLDETLPGSGESKARADLNAAEAAIAAFNSRKLVYRQIFENVFTLKGVPSSVFTDSVLNTAHVAQSDLTASGVARVTDVFVALAKRDERSRVRVERAFRWLAAAQADEGVDRFIKAWFALECLAPRKEKDINPALARAYVQTVEEVGMRFFVGRLHGARSDVVHSGVDIGTHGAVHDYMDALFVDVLNDLLGLECSQRAAAVLAKDRAPIEKTLALMSAAAKE